MEKLELKSKKVEVTFNGQVYQMNAPTYKQTIEYRKSIKECGGEEEAEAKALISYVSSLGMPAEVCEALEIEHLTQVLEFLSTKKK